MKKNILVLSVLAVAALLLLTVKVSGSDDWMTDFEAAKKAAIAQKVPLLVDFSGSDWCGWCIKLDQEVFSKKAFTQYAKGHLVLVLIDMPRRKKLSETLTKQNALLRSRFQVNGFPTVLLIDPVNEHVIARTGYRQGGPDQYVENLKSLLAPYESTLKKNLEQAPQAVAQPVKVKKPFLLPSEEAKLKKQQQQQQQAAATEETNAAVQKQ